MPETRKKNHFTFFIATLFSLSLQGQSILLRGVIKDAHSDERIPFASIQFRKTNMGKLTDSAGGFAFRFDQWPSDTLIVTYVGYRDYVLPLDSNLLHREKDGVVRFDILLERGKFAEEVVIKRKIDRGFLMWRRVVRRKAFNDRYRFNNFSYELYNKLELDIKNINKDKWKEARLMRPFKFIFENVDTSEGPPILPVYLTETISDYYFQKSPTKRREVIKGSKTIGVNNESATKLLGGMDQNVNFYSNYIPVFDKQFISPISDNGDNYYKYRVLDTQYVAGRRLFHLSFTPKRQGENTFEGDCWVHDTTFAVQKMNLRLSKEANINFVDQLSLIQEYALIDDTTWFLVKDKFVVDVSPLGNSKLSFIGRKTTTYRDVKVDDTSVTNELSKNKLSEETILAFQAKDKPDNYWDNSRHEELTKNEKAIYHMIDTLLKMPVFQRYTNWINFIGTGYMRIGNYEIGPWYNWITYNVQEGLRTRFDLGTNRFFNKKVILHGYLAYGFGDQQFKYKADALYLFKKEPRAYIYGSYLKDIDYGQTYYDEISQDNIFALAVRKANVPLKFLMIDEKRVELFKEWKVGFSAMLIGLHKTFDPLRNLPAKDLFPNGNSNDPLSTSEIAIRLRYAYLEKFIENTFYRSSLGSPYPIAELRITKGIAGIFQSSYDYTKLNGSVSDYIKVPPFGNIYYNVFGGKTIGTLPYMLLDIAPGNEIYYYNKYAFNLMNRYEFLHDQYAGINFEHNIGNGIFRFIPLLKKLKFRQFYSAKTLWGSLNEKNRTYNMPVSSPYVFESLNGKTYMEVGTGVDNIFKLFRLDFIWRVLPRPLPKESVKRFGIFGSFRVTF
ncbi:MAG TPA: DUF5686 family protein [Flavitalea sp.]|nr:DUF5686 family protein [Flavitalea sp.]